MKRITGDSVQQQLEHARRAAQLPLTPVAVLAKSSAPVEWVDTIVRPGEGRVAALRSGGELYFVREDEALGVGGLQRARQSTLGGLLGAETSQPVRPPASAAWSDPAIAAARLAAVVAHQNVLRAEKVLPLLSTSAPEALRDGGFVIEMPRGFGGDETTAGVFSVWGDTLMRAVYGDLFSLNQVYRFDGAALSSVVPYAQWALEQVPGETVTLHRQMRPEEAAQWQSGKLEGVGSDWGHGTPVVFFSTDHDQTSAAGDGTTLSFSVSKAALLAEAKRGAVWSAATELPEPGTTPVITEFVVPAQTVQQLVQRGELKAQ